VARQLAQSLQKGDAALVKGSRGMKLERFVMLADPIQFNPK
jgi:UDP-N-acetylmuramyl pentapeptide synthase